MQSILLANIFLYNCGKNGVDNHLKTLSTTESRSSPLWLHLDSPPPFVLRESQSWYMEINRFRATYPSNPCVRFMYAYNAAVVLK